MKKYYSLAVACVAMFFCSCKKENLVGTITNSTNAANTSASAELGTLKLVPNKATVSYGAMIGAPSVQGSTSFQLNIADQLGVSCLRSRTLVPGTTSVPILNYGYKVLLNFNSDYTHGPVPFVTNLPTYEANLRSLVSTFTVMPVVSIIENEESNTLYYSGTPQQYIEQLNTAINVMHAYGIKVANGGITSTGLNYLVYQDFLAQGKTDSALQFQQLTHVLPKSRITQDRGACVNTLLQAYAHMNLDYVNFHWKGTSPDTQALTEVIAYLKKVTGKTIITNELGQFDTDPNTLLSHVQKCTDSGFPYIIWYSPDENADKKAMPLQHSDQSLTSNGFAYQSYLKN